MQISNLPIALALLLALADAAKADYLINGSFETGDYTGWTRSGYGDGITTGEQVVGSDGCGSPRGCNWYAPERGNYYVQDKRVSY